MGPQWIAAETPRAGQSCCDFLIRPQSANKSRYVPAIDFTGTSEKWAPQKFQNALNPDISH